MAIPIAKRANYVVGVDVSISMLNEAKKNSELFGITNIEYVQSLTRKLTDKFNFVHSFIVFQHIPKRRGEIIFEQILSQMEDGAIGVIHFTFAKTNKVSKIAHIIRHNIPPGRNIINLVQKKELLCTPYANEQLQPKSYFSIVTSS